MADIQMQPEQQENAPVDAAPADQAPVPQNQGFVHSVVKMIPLGETTLNAAVWTYDTVKHSNSLLEGACNNVEGKVSRTIDTVVVRPAEAVAGVYNAGVENAKWAVNTTTSTAKHAGILSIGAGVLATQLSLQLAATGANYALDGVGMAQRGGRRVYTSIKELGEVVETMVWAAIEEAKTLGHIPVEKAAEYSHAFLDIARALMERGLAIDIGDETNLNLRERVTNMATVIASALHQKLWDASGF